MDNLTSISGLFSKNLKIIRKARNFTQHQLAEESGVSGGTIAKIEAGCVLPEESTMRLLAIALKVDTADFFIKSDNPIEDINTRLKVLENEISELNNTISNLQQISFPVTFNTTHSKPRK